MSDRFTALQQELHSILEDRFSELRQQVQQTEHLTREILRTEFATKNSAEKHTSLQLELDGLRHQNQQGKDLLLTTQKQLEDAQHSNQKLQERREQLTADIDSQGENNQSFTEELLQLETQHKALEEENAKLKLQIDFYQENIAKFRQLKEENMLSIMNLTNIMQDVSSGKD